jgi:hypothetical protein
MLTLAYKCLTHGYMRLYFRLLVSGVCIYTSWQQHAENANAQIGTFGFCQHTSQKQKTKRGYFLLTLLQTNKETNEMYIAKIKEY